MYSTVYKPLAKFLFAEEFLKWQTGQTQKSTAWPILQFSLFAELACGLFADHRAV